MSASNVEELYCKGTRVWVPDKERVWVGGEVVRVVTGEGVEVQCEGEQGTRLFSCDSLPLLRNPAMLVGANDLTTLSYLHEPAVLHNLTVRFLHSKTIYTYCGIVLVALNPYQSLPVYGNETAAAYRGRDMGEMDPHVFAVAEEAFRRMTRDSSNQSIIISGESGAGKTVSAKFVMRYFATVGGASAETQIERKVLASNPIMEAIGNAKTTRNDNSSRFGKYIEIRFDQRNRITGAHMRTYLLERSRVVTQATNERNYHIFYQLCAANDQAELMDYQLGAAESFHYISQGDCVTINDVNDQSEFTATKEALQLLGFRNNQLQGMFRVLSAILHLGNVEVGSCDKGGEVMSVIGEDDKHLVTSATLLGIDPTHLSHWLSHRKITTSREVYHKPLTHAQSITARDSLAKNLYSTLFDWIVNVINSSLSPSSSSSSSSAHRSFIGVLDIYGFEVFDENTFEQFCINYANEKLQQQFNMHVFQLEQAEYVREEIEWSFIHYTDNQPCIDLIENRLGILDLLDETCKMPGSCDSLFTQKLYDNHNTPNSTHFTKPRTSRSAFQVKHYAGPVQYQTGGFVEKNTEQVAEEYLQLLNKSSVPFLSSLYKPTLATPAKSNTNHRKKASTVGSQFRSSLHGLMTTLNSTTPHYIRCIKSNDRKLPFMFEPQRVTQQLRACGVLETIRLSAAGYPSRWTYNEFFNRYRLLLRSGQVRREDVRQMCEYILHVSIQDSGQYRFGKTKLFFRAGQVAYLEKLRSQRQQEASVCVQCHVKGWLRRRWYGRLRAATISVQAQVRGLLARKLAVCLRRTRAALCIQRHARGLVARLQYQRLRTAVITTQAIFRGQHARKFCLHLLHERKAVVLQKYVRGWLARLSYVRHVRCIVLAQCCVRRWRARKERRRLKMEARSVTHLHSLNKGLERKIIELQLRLVEGERERQAAQELWNLQKRNYEEALAKASSEVEHLRMDLELARASVEIQEAGPHSVPENENMELNQVASPHAELENECMELNQETGPHSAPANERIEQNQLVSPHSIPENESMEPKQMLNLHSVSENEPNQGHGPYSIPDIKVDSMELRQGGMELSQTEREAMECELARLRNALAESRVECCRLEERVTALQREFDTEDPTPALPPQPLSARNQGPAVKIRFSVTPPSPLRQSPAIENLSSILLLPPLPPGTKPGVGPSSSTPDMQNDGTGINMAAIQERIRKIQQQNAMELGQKAEQSNGLDSCSEAGRTSYESGRDTTDDEIECLKELVDQLERERQNLFLGNREMCQELNKVDATKMMTVSTLKKIAKENMLLRKELATVREMEGSYLQEMEQSRSEIEGLLTEVADMKLALQQAYTASSLNTSLQQEVTRLTEENLSLRETVEDTRRVHRTPMSPRRRTTPCGAESPRKRKLSPSARKKVTFSLNKSEPSSKLQPVWKSTKQSKLIRDLVLDLKPEQVSGQVPCLPAHMIHLSLRYCRHVTGSCGQSMAFMDEVISAIKQVVQASSSQFSVLAFWLANVTRLLSLLRDSQTGQTGSQTGLRVKPEVSEGGLTSDLSVRVDKLEALGQSTYRDLFQLIHNKIQPLIVPGVLEYESIPNISSVRPILGGCHAGSHDPNVTIAIITRELSAILDVLRKNCLSPETVGVLMKQTFFMINAHLLNNLLLRRDMCHWSKGIQIRYNLSQLEDWVRGHGLTGWELLTQLQPSVEAAKLLQMKKSTTKDADAICELCTHLNPLQVQKLLTMYSPANEFEERVPASIIRLVAQKNGADATDPAHLMLSIDHVFPVAFPHSPSNINYRALSLPPAMRHLKYLLTTA